MRRKLLGRAIGVAMQLWGTGARAPLDFQLVKLLRTNTENVQNNAIFAQFLSNFGPFLSFFCPQFSSGSIWFPKSIANKFQLHTYFRFQ